MLGHALTIYLSYETAIELGVLRVGTNIAAVTDVKYRGITQNCLKGSVMINYGNYLIKSNIEMTAISSQSSCNSFVVLYYVAIWLIKLRAFTFIVNDKILSL